MANLPSTAAANRRPLLRLSMIETLLGTLLAAHRGRNLQELLSQRPGATRWFSRRYLREITGAAGDQLGDDIGSADAVTILFRWTIMRMRPDRADDSAPIDRAAWLNHTSWRPLLALASHYGFLLVPDFNDRYRRRADESAADNLCGLWAVGTSTFYRYLDKGKRQMAEALLAWPPESRMSVSLRRATHRSIALRASWPDSSAMEQWHRAQIDRSLVRRDPCSALWHTMAVANASAFIETLRRHRVELAREAEVDALVAEFLAHELTPRERFDLLISLAALWTTRNEDDRARQVYEDALHFASRRGDKVMLGVAYGALGKFHESRDTDKALACLEDSAEFLRQVTMQPGSVDGPEAHAEYLSALQRLGWFHVLRNDPRSRTVLDTAQAIRQTHPGSEVTEALLEQTWGEYWRRAGDLRRALEHKHRALNVFERLGDMREVLSTYNNLSLLYNETNDYDLAADYARRVVQAADRSAIDSYLLTSALGNLGIARFFQGRYDEAIEHYRVGLKESIRAGLPVIASRAHYNLAEAHFKRYLVSRDPEDERLGDHHIAQTMASGMAERDSALQQAAPGLKAEILGAEGRLVHDRMWPAETAAHFDDMAVVQRHRSTLALPGHPADRIRAHLAIANAYLTISTKEREAALALIRQHGLGSEFDAEIDALQMTFSRELTREKVLTAQWKQKSYGVLTEDRASAVLHQVLEAGAINKSGYAHLCQVGLATASKHLGTLAERGLLVQMGKGPSTRYVLP